jgi:hypothetical protein
MRKCFNARNFCKSRSCFSKYHLQGNSYRMKPCNHIPPRDGCRLCWLFDHDPRYRALWGGDPTTVATSVTTTGATPPAAGPTPDQLEMLRKIKLHMASPCQHLGEALEAKPSCGCGGTLAILHVCGRHDRCRISSRDQSHRNCITCDDYEPRVPDAN